jgi:hypothetical protein
MVCEYEDALCLQLLYFLSVSRFLLGLSFCFFGLRAGSAVLCSLRH